MSLWVRFPLGLLKLLTFITKSETLKERENVATLKEINDKANELALLLTMIERSKSTASEMQFVKDGFAFFEKEYHKLVLEFAQALLESKVSKLSGTLSASDTELSKSEEKFFLLSCNAAGGAKLPFCKIVRHFFVTCNEESPKGQMSFTMAKSLSEGFRHYVQGTEKDLEDFRDYLTDLLPSGEWSISYYEGLRQATDPTVFLRRR